MYYLMGEGEVLKGTAVCMIDRENFGWPPK